MDNKMVFERYEYKYLLNRRQQDAVLRAMEPYMALDEYGRSSIRNVYYDTPDYRLIRESLSQPLYKEKLRVRSYGPAAPEDPVFVELKKKYEGIVYKRRISMKAAMAEQSLLGKAPMPACQIGREIEAALNYYETLMPAVYLSYQREAFYSRDNSGFRVTFDDCILFRREALSLSAGDWGTPLLPQDTVLLELKISQSIPFWMARALSENGIYKSSFSKYGSAYTRWVQEERNGNKKYA